MSVFHRFSRWILGVGLLSWAIAGGPFWAYIGVYFLITGSWAYCPVQRLVARKQKPTSDLKNT